MANRHFDKAITSFTQQFELEGETYLYRRGLKGAPIPVSASERDGFIADYSRHLRRLTWGFAGVAMVAIMILSFLTTADGREIGDVWLYGLIVLATIPFLIVHHRIWNAPTRQIGRRMAVGKERSRSEVKRIMLAQVSWVQLSAAVVFVPVVMISLAGDRNIWHGGGRLWLVFVGMVELALLYQMFRKWQIGAGGD